jgi:hypothetical protein
MKDPENVDGWTAMYVQMRDIVLAPTKEEMNVRCRHLGVELAAVAWHFMYQLPSSPNDQAVYDDRHKSSIEKLDHLREVLDTTKRTTPGFLLPYLDS